jgi:hypothetical protein
MHPRTAYPVFQCKRTTGRQSSNPYSGLCTLNDPSFTALAIRFDVTYKSTDSVQKSDTAATMNTNTMLLLPLPRAQNL